MAIHKSWTSANMQSFYIDINFVFIFCVSLVFHVRKSVSKKYFAFVSTGILPRQCLFFRKADGSLNVPKRGVIEIIEELISYWYLCSKRFKSCFYLLVRVHAIVRIIELYVVQVFMLTGTIKNSFFRWDNCFLTFPFICLLCVLWCPRSYFRLWSKATIVSYDDGDCQQLT